VGKNEADAQIQTSSLKLSNELFIVLSGLVVDFVSAEFVQINSRWLALFLNVRLPEAKGGSYAKHGAVNGEVSNNASGCSWYFS